MNLIKLCCIPTLVCIVSFSHVKGQSQHDMVILRDHSFELKTAEPKREVTFGISSRRNVIVRYNPVSLAFGSLMYTYQKIISPQMGSRCMFIPSCSEFGKELIKEYGILKGVFTTADRLTRCHRISATTINPVSVNEDDMKIHETTDYYRISKRCKHH